MSPRDDPGEQLLDLLVYAPLGLLLEVRDLVPKLADKGRQRMGAQVKVARFVGQFAVRRGQTKVEEVVTRLREQPRRPDAATADRPTNGSQPAAPRPVSSRPTAPRPPTRPAAARPTAGRPAAAAAGPEPAAATLAIPGYDTLSASQVVPRLEGLSPQELEAVRAYESASRRRKTILTRIDQLLGGH